MSASASLPELLPALPPLIDTHCHLTHDYSPKTAEDLIREAWAAGLVSLVSIGTELEGLNALQSLAEKNENVYFTAGIHPHEAVTLNEGYLEILEKAASHPKCRAIGEIGLDFYYDHSPREVQIQRFREQLNLAARLHKPVVIHCRDAEEDLLNALKDYAPLVSSDTIPGIIHCFSGTEGFGKECLKLGFYISISGIITFKKADELRSAVETFPIEKLLVETDSPYLAPMPMRGKKCEPAMVVHTAKKLAELKKIPFEELARVTTESARRVFKI